MRQLVTSEQALQLDQRTQQINSVIAESLMDRAGEEIFTRIVAEFLNLESVLVLVGPGNNGGDGLVIARSLAEKKLKVLVVAPHEGTSELWIKKKNQLLETHSDLEWVNGNDLATFFENHKSAKWSLLIDAAFGVGLGRPLSALWVSTLSFLGERTLFKVAVDIPSGLNATTGLRGDGVLTFDRTYTLGLAKLGLVVGDGPSVCGRISVLDIGFSDQAMGELNLKIFYFGIRDAVRALPEASDWALNKSVRGNLLIIAGSPGMEGAGALASLAGARMGAGYVTWARWPEKDLPTPEVILSAVLDEGFRFLDSMKPPSAVVVGPGLGINERSQRLIRNVYEQFRDISVVVDADALHLLKMEGLYPVPKNWILTPHAGELARILGVSVAEINNNRLMAVLKAQKELGGTVLLKGYRSLVADGAGRVVVIGSGGPVLGKAGTGDVLAGMVGGCLAMGMSPEAGLLLSSFIHGRAGDLFAKKWKNDFSMIASDLIDMIPKVLRGLYGKK